MNFKKYKCLMCNNCFFVQKQTINNRRYRKGEEICKKCYKKVRRKNDFLLFYPKELMLIAEDDIWDLDKIKPFMEKLGRSKRKVKFICQECFKKDIMTINAMKNRKICGTKPICRCCSLKFAVNSEQWRKSNSDAQKIAQNRPETIKKQRIAQLKLMSKDPLYAEKRCSKSFISGTIRGQRFDSSWELYFIVNCWENKKIKSIHRYTENIIYYDNNGIKRRYYPDFIVEFLNGDKKIVEIKGSRKYNNFLEKFNTARKKYGANYIVLEEKDLEKIGIHMRNEMYLKDFYKKYFNEIKFYNNKKSIIFKKKVKRWLK